MRDKFFVIFTTTSPLVFNRNASQISKKTPVIIFNYSVIRGRFLEIRAIGDEVVNLIERVRIKL